MTSHFTHEHDQEIADLYRAGQTTYEIGTRFGVSPNPIKRALERQGVALRPSGKRAVWTGTQQECQAAVDAYLGGESIRVMAARLGVRATWIIDALDSAGITRRHRGSQSMLSPEQVDEIVAAYQGGEMLTALAEQYGCTHVTIRNYLVKRGVALRAPGISRFWTDERMAEVAQRYWAGESQQQIAASLGCSQSGVSDALRRLGVPGSPTMSGESHPSWKGGRHVTKGGYVWVKVPDGDPLAVMRLSNGYVPEHRLVMARLLGRPLTSTETVHHKDLDHSNNAPGNLQLRQGKHGKGAAFCCADCGSSNIQAVDLT